MERLGDQKGRGRAAVRHAAPICALRRQRPTNRRSTWLRIAKSKCHGFRGAPRCWLPMPLGADPAAASTLLQPMLAAVKVEKGRAVVDAEGRYGNRQKEEDSKMKGGHGSGQQAHQYFP